jgi:hypothetical protein
MSNELNFLTSFDIVFLQETYLGTRDSVLDLDGYIPHHQLGRQTPRRYQWGVTTLMRIEAFAGSVICRIPSPVDWIVASRWRHESDIGLVMINIYHPVHSDGYSPQDSQTVLAFVNSLRIDFPGDGFVLGGDFNVDRWRVNEQQSAGLPIPTASRLVSKSSVTFTPSLGSDLFILSISYSPTYKPQCPSFDIILLFPYHVVVPNCSFWIWKTRA